MGGDFYETDKALSEYLLFHFGLTRNLLPRGVDRKFLDFPVRCVQECVQKPLLKKSTRALDLGCAVGRATFELARSCEEVIGIDRSKRFIAAANHLRNKGSLEFAFVEEGVLTRRGFATVPAQIKRSRARFLTGDASALNRRLGTFDIVLMANLIDRVGDPRKCLNQMKALVNPCGQLILTSPYTWLREYTPRQKWLGGYKKSGIPVRTFEAIKEILTPAFRLLARHDLPFIIREHARKYQLGIAEASVWLRK